MDGLSEKQRQAKRVTQQYDEQLNNLERAIYDMRTRRDHELVKLGMTTLYILQLQLSTPRDTWLLLAVS